jgi:hypothetical protein
VPLRQRRFGHLEQRGVAAALERCRVLTEAIVAKLGEKTPQRLDIAALAEFKASLEHAASVLNEQRFRDDDESPNPLPPPATTSEPQGS